MIFFPVFIVILDTVLGEVSSKYHPICYLGSTATYAENTLKKLANNPHQAFLYGILCFLVVFMLFCLIPVLFYQAINKEILFYSEEFSYIFSLSYASLITYICIAPTSLTQHVENVLKELEKNNLIVARLKLSWIVGRNTEEMDEAQISRASIETLAENSVDCFFASLFWAFVGFFLFSFSGLIFFVCLHRIANTLDAMWGKRNEEYEYFGKFVARLDDILNYLPARFSFIPIILACLITKDCNTKNALLIGYKYRNSLASPNSAWAEAPYAGALNLKLAGPVWYKDFYCDYPYIGEGNLNANKTHIKIALSLYKNSIFINIIIYMLAFSFL